MDDFFENIAPKVGLSADAFEDLSSEQKLGAYANALEVADVSSQEMIFYMEALAFDATLLTKVFAKNGAKVDRLSSQRRPVDRLTHHFPSWCCAWQRKYKWQ